MFRIWFSQIMLLYREVFPMQPSCFMDFFFFFFWFFVVVVVFFFCAFVG